MSELTTKTAARLERGDRVILTPRDPKRPNQVRRIQTVDHTLRLPNGVIRVFYGRYGMMHVDAAGSHLFEHIPDREREPALAEMSRR